MFNKYCTGGSSFNIKNRVLILEGPILHCIYIYPIPAIIENTDAIIIIPSRYLTCF